MEEIDLKELFSLFWSKRIIIVLITLILMFIGIIYTYFFITPEYTATTNLILVQASSNSQNGQSGITSADLTINSKLVSTYSELIKKNTILDQVASNLNIEQSEIRKIKNKISVSSAKDTEIIEINVKNENAEYATKIANEIAKVFCEKIVEIYNISNTYLLDRAEVPTNPSNINHIKDIIIFTFIGIVISAGYILLINMLDNTIKTEEDIEKITGLTVLASIPNYDVEFKEAKGGRR